MLERRHLDRKMPWRLVKKYCHAAGIDPTRLGARGIGIHSAYARPRSTTPSATAPRCTRCANSPVTADIRTTELYFIRKEEDAEVAARRIQIRLAVLGIN